MKYLDTITDKTIFSNPEFKDCDKYTNRIKVVCIVKNKEEKIALITNDIHNMYMFPGGGAESNNLEKEINREIVEEISCDLVDIQEIARIKEFRNRDAKEYETVCFVANANNFYATDNRTDEEKRINLKVFWVSPSEVSEIFEKQADSIKNNDVGFYNTAFSVYRDNAFWQKYIENISE